MSIVLEVHTTFNEVLTPSSSHDSLLHDSALQYRPAVSCGQIILFVQGIMDKHPRKKLISLDIHFTNCVIIIIISKSW